MSDIHRLFWRYILRHVDTCGVAEEVIEMLPRTYQRISHDGETKADESVVSARAGGLSTVSGKWLKGYRG